MASTSGPGRNVFLTRALEKILSEREIKRSQHNELRKSCESTLSKYAQSHSVNSLVPPYKCPFLVDWMDCNSTVSRLQELLWTTQQRPQYLV